MTEPVDGHTWALHRKALKALVNKRVVLILKLAGSTGSLYAELLHEDGDFNVCCTNGDRITIHPSGVHSIVGNTITVTR